MAYLDKGVNNLTMTFRQSAGSGGQSGRVAGDVKWKEYSGSDWTVDRQFQQIVKTSPATFRSRRGYEVPRRSTSRWRFWAVGGRRGRGRRVTIGDLLQVSAATAGGQGWPGYDAQADLDGNGLVDIQDCWRW